jgi:putative phage-type endonuclease
MKFITLDLTQDTLDWHRWRSDGVGSSDAVVIDGWTSYKSLEQLTDEKVHRRTHITNDATALAGKANERQARLQFEKLTGIRLSLPTCVQSNVYPWLRASLDAASFTHNFVVEIKCGARQFSSHEGSTAVAPWISIQVQHALAVTGFDYGYVVFWHPHGGFLKRTIRRNQRTINHLLDKEQDFWFEVERRRGLL